MSDLLGFEWVSEHTGITAAQPFAVHSNLGTTRRTVVSGYTRDETYPFALRPEPTIAAHLTFAFKHEIVHLEFFGPFVRYPRPWDI